PPAAVHAGEAIASKSTCTTFCINPMSGGTAARASIHTSRSLSKTVGRTDASALICGESAFGPAPPVPPPRLSALPANTVAEQGHSIKAPFLREPCFHDNLAVPKPPPPPTPPTPTPTPPP
ncbi:unnamed protein product, partial [Ectocarpus sp. 8 AP-2014]